MNDNTLILPAHLTRVAAPAAQDTSDLPKEGPRVTAERIEDLITAEAYCRFPDTTVIVCCLTLANGFSVIGHSACASPENFDQELGRQLAYADAKRKVWPLEGYLLKQWQLLENQGELDFGGEENTHG